jgi:transcriptional regulator GlxA family with amidase domain
VKPASRSQSRYMALSFLSAKDADVTRAERWAREQLGTGVTVDGLAAAAGLGTRAFARRVGYAEPTTLRRLLKREGEGRPRELRAV